VKKVKTMRKNVSLRSMIGAALFAVFLAGCPMPVETPLLQTVKATVDAYNQQQQGTRLINVKYGTTDVASGSALDVGGTVAGTDKLCVFTIENKGTGNLTLTGDPKVEIGGTDVSSFSVSAPPATSVIPAGGATTFTISLLGSSGVAPKTSTVTIKSDDKDNGLYSFTITAEVTTAPQPDINIKGDDGVSIADGGGYAYLPTLVLSYLDAVFTVENLGIQDLSLDGNPKVLIEGNDASQFSLTVQPSSLVTSASSTMFTVRFAPSAEGTKSATVIISNNDPDENPYNFSVTGYAGIVPEMNVKQGTTNIPDGTGSHTFASTLVGTTVDVVFTIENLGTGDLHLTGTPNKVVIGGADASLFTVTADPATPVAPSGSTTFTIRFAPISAGTKNATVSIADDDSDENPYTFDISGLGTIPEMNIKQGTTDIPDGTGSYTYADTALNEYTDAIFTVENLGTADLHLTGTPNKVFIGGSHPSMFSVEVAPSSPVAPSGSTTFTIRFIPSSAGSWNAVASIANDDSNENPYNFAIAGTCVLRPEMNVKQGTTNIPDGTGSYTFADTMLTAYTDAVFTVQNLGTAGLNLSGTPNVVVGGADASLFTVTAYPSTPVAAGGGSTTFTVRFSPTGAVGLKSATLSIANDDVDENPYNFAISGTATEWHGKQAVDTTGNVGMFTSIAVSGSNVYISYYDSTNGDLKFARSTDGGATWPAGNIKTVDSTGDVGTDTSIAVSASNICISYYDSTNGDLKFARSVDGGATWPDVKPVDSTGNVGLYSSIAADLTNVYISYFDITNAKLKFAKSTNGGTSWLAGNIKTVDSTASVGVYTSIAVSGTNVYVSYYDSTNANLKFAMSTDGGATWPAGNIKIVDSTGDVGSCTSISHTSTGFGNVYISYLDTTNGDLKFAKSTDDGTTWLSTDIKTVDSGGSVGSDTSIKAASSLILISYFDATNFDLKFAKSTDSGATWPAGNIKTVDATGSSGFETSIANYIGNVYISHYDQASGDLRFAKSIDVGVTW
jgi:hypothetical protein